MSMHLVLACAAVVGALVLAARHRPLLFPVIALAVAGLEALMALRVVNVRVSAVPLDLVLGGALVVCGAVVYARSSAKIVVAAATVVFMVGALQLLAGLHLR
jgi:hypothetical protein